MNRKILVTNWVHADARRLLSQFGEVEANLDRTPWSPSEIAQRAKDASAMVAFMTDSVNDAFLAGCPNLKVIACALKGADNFDLDACRRRGVSVSIVPDLLTAPTAELTVGLMIMLGRNLLLGDRAIRSQGFSGWRPTLYGTGLDGSAVGIIGMGAVGQAIARRVAAFRSRISYFDEHRLRPSEEDALGIVYRDMKTIIAESDYLVLAAPLTNESFHMIGAEQLASMKSGALLINPARGSLVSESAVADALESGHLGGYAADVHECEDWAIPGRPDGIDERLILHPRTVLTPHLGSGVDRIRQEISMAAVSDIGRFFSGQLMRGGVIDARMPDAMTASLETMHA